MEPELLVLAVADEEIDVATAPTMVQAVCDGMDAAGRWEVVVDLTGVTFMDSSGMGGLVRIYHHARSHGGSLALTGVQSQPAKVIQLAGLTSVLPILVRQDITR